MAEILSILLTPQVADICRRSSDKLVMQLPDVLNAFAALASTKRAYDFKTLPDAAFERIVQAEPHDPGRFNRLMFSDSLRKIEAYQIVTMWRADELARAALSSLSSEIVIAGGTCARALVELSVRYLIEANEVDHLLRQIPWEKCDGQVLLPQRQTGGGRTEDMHAYFARLFWGTRMKERLKEYPELQEKNAITYIAQYEKYLKKHASNWSLEKEYYEFLCELTHPNFVGNTRYTERITSEGDWEVLKLSAGAKSQDFEMIANKICGAVSFSLQMILNGFELFQQTKVALAPRVGRIYP